MPQIDLKEKLKGKSLRVMTPMYGGVSFINYFSSFVALSNLCTQLGVPMEYTAIYNESDIVRARNRCCDVYRKEGEETHAVFIDADIGFEAIDILAMMAMDLDILGVPCTKKSIRWDRIAAAIKKNQRPLLLDEYSRIGGDFVFNTLQGKADLTISLHEPNEMRQMGTGLLMIKREVFEQYEKNYPDRWYESPEDPMALPGPIVTFFRSGINPESRKYETEDYCFCEDTRAFGAKVWMAPWIVTSHMGTYKFVADMPAVTQLVGAL
jgi:hypothetical protein